MKIPKHIMLYMMMAVFTILFLPSSYSAIIDDLRDEIYFYVDFEDPNNHVDLVNLSPMHYENVTFNSTAKWGNRGACFDTNTEMMSSTVIPQSDNMTVCFWYNNMYNGLTGFFGLVSLTVTPANAYLNFGEGSASNVHSYYFRSGGTASPLSSAWYINDTWQFVCGGFSISGGGRSGNDTIHVYTKNNPSDEYLSGSMTRGEWNPYNVQLVINGRDNNSNLGLNGCYDDVMVFTDLLSEAEMDYLYDNHLTLVDIDADPPVFDHTLENFTRTNLDIASWNYDINATDNISGVDTYTVNSTNFTITSQGLLSMKSPYPSGLHPLTISVNDTVGNINYGYMFVNVTIVPDVTAPTIRLISPANASLQLSPFTITFNVTDDGFDDQICQLNEITTALKHDTIAFYRFEEGSGSIAYDETSYSHDGTITNSNYTSSKGSNATGSYSMHFNGIDTYIRIQDHDNFTFALNNATNKAFSVGAWVYMNDATGFRIASKYQSNLKVEWFFSTDSSDLITFSVYDLDNNNRIGRRYSTPMTALENRWIYLTATYDGSITATGINIYMNATPIDNQDTISGSFTAMHNTDADVEIGSILNGTNYAHGRIDEFFIINKKLSQSEIQDIYDYGLYNDSESIIYDYGTFGQDKNSYINYSGSLPNDFNLQCWDNSLNNNTAFIGLYYDTDSIFPSLSVYSPLNNSIFQIDTQSIIFNASCSDANFVNINVSLYNSSHILFSNNSLTGNVQGIFNVTDVGEGFYYAGYECYDIVGNKAYEIETVEFSSSPYPVIQLIDPSNNTVFTADPENLPYFINFTFNVSQDTNCSLYLNSIYNGSIDSINNTLSVFENRGYGNETDVQWYVKCQNSFSGISKTRYFSIRFPEVTKEFAIPLDSLQNTFILFILAILYIGVMVIAFAFKNFGFGSLGFFLGIILGFVLGQIHIILAFVFIFINTYIFYRSVSGFGK